MDLITDTVQAACFRASMVLIISIPLEIEQPFSPCDSVSLHLQTSRWYSLSPVLQRTVSASFYTSQTSWLPRAVRTTSNLNQLSLSLMISFPCRQHIDGDDDKDLLPRL